MSNGDRIQYKRVHFGVFSMSRFRTIGAQLGLGIVVQIVMIFGVSQAGLDWQIVFYMYLSSFNTKQNYVKVWPKLADCFKELNKI